MEEKPIEEMTLRELLDHTERFVRLLAQNIRDELERIKSEKKDKEVKLK